MKFVNIVCILYFWLSLSKRVPSPSTNQQRIIDFFVCCFIKCMYFLLIKKSTQTIKWIDSHAFSYLYSYFVPILLKCHVESAHYLDLLVIFCKQNTKMYMCSKLSVRFYIYPYLVGIIMFIFVMLRYFFLLEQSIFVSSALSHDHTSFVQGNCECDRINHLVWMVNVLCQSIW